MPKHLPASRPCTAHDITFGDRCLNCGAGGPPATPKKPAPKPYDEIGNIIAFETGSLPPKDALRLFAHLVKNGHAWTLQGYYGRTAAHLIHCGHLSQSGEILADLDPE